MLVVSLLIDQSSSAAGDNSKTTDPNVEYEYYDDDEEITSGANVIATTTSLPEVIETITKQALNVSRRTTILSGLTHYTKSNVKGEGDAVEAKVELETTTLPIGRQAYNGSRRTTIFSNPKLYADATESYTTFRPVHSGRRTTILSNNPSASPSSATSLQTTTTTIPSSPTTLNPYDNELAATQPINAHRRTSVFTRPAVRTTTPTAAINEEEGRSIDNDDVDNENEDEQLPATTTVLPQTTQLPLIRTTRTSTTAAATTTTTTTTPAPRPRTRRINLRPSTKKYEKINRLHEQEENTIRGDALNRHSNQDNVIDNNDDIKQEEFLYYRDRTGLRATASTTTRSTTVYRRPNAIIDQEHSENRKEFTETSKRPTFATTERDDSYFSRRYARFLFRQRTG